MRPAGILDKYSLAAQNIHCRLSVRTRFGRKEDWPSARNNYLDELPIDHKHWYRHNGPISWVLLPKQLLQKLPQSILNFKAWTSSLEALVNRFKKKPTISYMIHWPYIWVIWKVKKIMLEDIIRKNNRWILWRQKSPHSIHRWEQDLNLKFVNFYIEPPLSNLVRQLLYSVIEFSMMNHLRGRLPIVWNIHRLNDFSKSHRTSKYRNLIWIHLEASALEKIPRVQGHQFPNIPALFLCICSFLCTSAIWWNPLLAELSVWLAWLLWRLLID